jgi:uncharacterized membrane protein YbhN (UPF0104 family)
VPTPSAFYRSRSFWLRIAMSAGVLALVLKFVGGRDRILGELGRISVSSWALAALCFVFGLLVASLRWRVLLAAYGATSLPSWPRTLRLYFESFSLNTLVPGAIVGDVARALEAESSFAEHGKTRSLAVALFERLLGLAALIALAALMLTLNAPSLFGIDRRVTSAVAIASSLGAIGAVLALGTLPSFANKLPARAAAIAARLPRLASRKHFAFALGLSVFTHVGSSVASLILLTDAPESFGVVDALFAFTLANAAAFFPLTWGGLGVREGAYASVLAAYGIGSAAAVSLSLASWMTQSSLSLVIVLAIAVAKRMKKSS